MYEHSGTQQINSRVKLDINIKSRNTAYTAAHSIKSKELTATKLEFFLAKNVQNQTVGKQISISYTEVNIAHRFNSYFTFRGFRIFRNVPCSSLPNFCNLQ